MPSYARLDVRTSCETLTRKMLCRPDDDVVCLLCPLLLWSDGLGRSVTGLMGALTGLGGGVIVPLLALGFGVDIRYAHFADIPERIAQPS